MSVDLCVFLVLKAYMSLEQQSKQKFSIITALFLLLTRELNKDYPM